MRSGAGKIFQINSGENISDLVQVSDEDSLAGGQTVGQEQADPGDAVQLLGTTEGHIVSVLLRELPDVERRAVTGLADLPHVAAVQTLLPAGPALALRHALSQPRTQWRPLIGPDTSIYCAMIG